MQKQGCITALSASYSFLGIPQQKYGRIDREIICIARKISESYPNVTETVILHYVHKYNFEQQTLLQWYSVIWNCLANTPVTIS